MNRRSVVGVTVEPVIRQPVREPHPPSDDEALHQVGVEQRAGDIRDDQRGENQHGHPEALNCSIFRLTFAFEGGLHGRELVVGLVGEQHHEPNVDHHQRQQHAQQRPHRDALTTLEVITGDTPELPAPGGVPGEQGANDDHADRGEYPGLRHPQRRPDQLVAPIQGRRERFHAGKLPRHRYTGAGSVSSPCTRPNRHSPSPSNSSSCVWCCSTVLRWLTLTRMVFGSSLRTRL